jgi:hypothetical protein
MTVSADEFLRRFLLHVLPKGLVRIRHFGLFANRRRMLRSNSAASCSAQLHVQIAPKQRTCRVAPPARQPCWSSNGSPALNFTSDQIEALLPYRGAALTALKTSALNVSNPVARWHACTCKAVLCQKAVQVPSIRPSTTYGRRNFRLSRPLPLLQRANFASIVLPTSISAPLKIHS